MLRQRLRLRLIANCRRQKGCPGAAIRSARQSGIKISLEDRRAREVKRRAKSAGQVEAVELHCRGTKEIGFLAVASALPHKLASGPDNRKAVGAFVDVKVHYKKARRRGERIDEGLDGGTPVVRQRLG